MLPWGCWRHARMLHRMPRNVEQAAFPNTQADDAEKGCQQQPQHPQRTLPNGIRAAQIPRNANHYHRQRPRHSAMAGRQGWIELTKVRDSERGINRHVEDAGGKRQPRLLKSPEATECAADPDVEAAIFRERAGQFTHHQRGRQTPDKGDDAQQPQGAPIAGLSDNIFQSIRTARHHEVCSRNQGKQP